MMDNFVIGNMAWNAVLIAIVAFFIRKWISAIETSTKEAALHLITTAECLRKETQEKAREIKVDSDNNKNRK